MSRFNRGIINGVIIVMTTAALFTSWIAGVDIHPWIWGIWVITVLMWVAYDSHVTGVENKHVQQSVDAAVRAIMDAIKAPTERQRVGDALLQTHTEQACQGEACCIHNPSDHHMKNWGLMWRTDKMIMERVCPHGTGHPDPDDVAWRERTGRKSASVHGCDGCCIGVIE